jgi:phosphomannomutase
MRLLHDYLHGAAGREMMLAFDEARAELTPLHFAANGQFPLGDPNPVKQSVTRQGMEALAAGDYDFASFFDGDGDRIDFYRGDGTYLSSSFVYAGILPYIRRRFPGDAGVYADLKSNPLAIMEMARADVRVEVIRNGHSQIKNSMFEDPTMVGTVEESAHFYELFPAPGEDDRNPGAASGARFATENTLYIALLAAKAWKENRERFDELFSIQARTAREREWGYKFPTDELRSQALDAVRGHFEAGGARAMTRMPNGYELEATLMRKGLPFQISHDTKLEADWLQVCQRISQSENGLARWEVVAAGSEIARAAKEAIGRIVQKFGAGEEYQG